MSDKYRYDFEYDVQYVYTDCQVLKNKLGIKNSDVLIAAEREITSMWIARLKTEPLKGKLDFSHLKSIHRCIFSDIYDWAGEPRVVDIAKGNEFCRSIYIDDYADSIFSRLKNEKFLLLTEKIEIPQRLAYYMSEINVLHPFREGNGRTQRLFIEYLGAVCGFHIDFSDVSENEMIMASANAYAKDYDMINKMFERICVPVSLTEQEKSIRFFFGEKSTEYNIFKEL
jgi:cell filamentation protein